MLLQRAEPRRLRGDCIQAAIPNILGIPLARGGATGKALGAEQGDAMDTNSTDGAISAAEPTTREDPPPVRELPFLFTGNASEYFRIWVVNTLLTIATLGIYSAWAKVRTRQYFYRNTLLNGSSFDYLADPIPILKGRLIVATALIALGVAQRFFAPLYFVLIALLLLATPWVLVKSLAFNARNSAYRNIRFAFPARPAEAFGVYLKMMLFYFLTCGLAYPLAQWTLTRFVVWRHYYGDLQFNWVTKCGRYYRTYLIALLLAIPGYAMMLGTLATTAHNKPAPQSAAMILPMALFFLWLLIPAAYLRAELSNLLYGGMTVGDHRLESTQRFGAMLKLLAVNSVAIVFSAGLLIPWAKIRMAQYRAATLRLHASGPLYAESLLTDATSAVAEGMHDLGDFDLGIGV